MGAGVTCEHCGGSTPLPDDLRVPHFACRYCEARLTTARYAGKVASADAHIGWITNQLDGQGNSAPFEAADIGHGKMSAEERWAHEMKRSAELTAAISEVRARGLDCHECGANNTCPPLHQAQRPCASCGTVLLLTSYLPEDAVTRARLGHGAAALTQKSMQTNARFLLVSCGVVVLVVGVLGVVAVSFL